MQRTVLSAALLGLGSVSLAQEAPSAAVQQLERVEITGSHIKRIDAEGVDAVQVIRQAEIRSSGVSTVKALMDLLTASNSSLHQGNLSDVTGALSFASGGSSASLRGLGKQATLILLNSRRVAPYAFADYSEVFTNLDALPLEAVDRVEILRSGASAVYGSDAVAGVINIITRSDYRGVELRAAHEQSALNKEFNSRSASLTAGRGDLGRDGHNLIVNLELYQRSRVMWGEVLDDVNPEASLMFPGFGRPSVYSFPGNVQHPTVAGSYLPLPGCAPQRIVGGLCTYDRYADFQAQPSSDRVNLLVSGQRTLGPSLDGFAEALLSRNETTYRGARQVYGFASDIVWGNPTTGERRTFTYRGLPAGHPLNPTGLNDAELLYRFADAPSGSVVESTNYRLLAGLRGQWADYDWESAVGAMGGRTVSSEYGFFSDSGFRQVIGNYDPSQVDAGFFNRDYRIGQINSAAVLGRLFPTFGTEGQTTQLFWDGKLTGDIAQWQGRPVGAALGFDVRHERFKTTPSANLLAGDIVGLGVSISDARRTQGSVFGEINLPLASGLDLQAAGRVDKFPGFDAHLSPKLGLRFEPSDTLLLRSTLESGFRAPNLIESAPSTKYAYDVGVVDPTRCPQALRLADDLYAAAGLLPDADPNKAVLLARADRAVFNECAASVASVMRHNPGLKPEVSRSLTAGLVFEPRRGLSMSLDFWRIERRDEILYRSTQELLEAESTLPPGVVSRQAPGGTDSSFTPAERVAYGVTTEPLVATANQFQNLAKTRTSGFDFGIRSQWKSALGPVELGLHGTYLLKFQQYSVLRGDYGDNLAGRYSYPRLKARASAAIQRGHFTHTLQAHLASATSLQGDFFDTLYTEQGCADAGWGPGQCRVKQSITFDYHLSYTGLKNLSLGLNVRNLFNRRPPVDLRLFQEYGSGAIPQDILDVQGRAVRLMLSYQFQ